MHLLGKGTGPLSPGVFHSGMDFSREAFFNSVTVLVHR